MRDNQIKRMGKEFRVFDEKSPLERWETNFSVDSSENKMENCGKKFFGRSEAPDSWNLTSTVASADIFEAKMTNFRAKFVTPVVWVWNSWFSFIFPSATVLEVPRRSSFCLVIHLQDIFPAVILSYFILSRCTERVSGREDETIVINSNGS